MAFPRQNLFWSIAVLPFAFLVAVIKKLPPRLPSAIFATFLAAIASGTASLGFVFILFDFGVGVFAPDPNLIIFLVILTLLSIIHFAMIRAEASTANYVIGRGATFGSRWRPYFAFGGAILGHFIWFVFAAPHIQVTELILRDEFSLLFYKMVLPSALLASPLASFAALIAPSRR